MSLTTSIGGREFVAWPSRTRTAGVEQVGGKGVGIFQLQIHDLPVPPTFVLTTDAYTEFCRERADAVPALREPVGKPDWPGFTKKWRDAFLTRSLYGKSPILERVQERLVAAIGTLGFAHEPFEPGVAVRSSATVEDSDEKSYAGMFLSTLSVRTYGGILGAVVRCWASLWTPMLMEGLAPEDRPKMAVVVQETIPADVAGVAFSSIPGAPDSVLIDSSWGLAKGVVDGTVSPDNFRADVHTENVRFRLGEKQLSYSARDGNGVDAHETPSGQRLRPSLTAQQALELARLCKRAEVALGKPLDLEWTLYKGRFRFVQARPLISARFRNLAT